MKDNITVECQKLNGKQFVGTVNFSEAKVKIFQNGIQCLKLQSGSKSTSQQI